MAAGYEVTDVHQRERFTPGGARVSYYDVTIVTTKGATGTLRLKADDYNKAELPQKLKEYVEKLNLAFTL